MSQRIIPPAGQVWDAEAYSTNASFVADYGKDVLVLLAPQAGEEILDLGCGDGVLTAQIAESGTNVVGLEPDPSLANAARARGLTVLEQSARDPFGTAKFDAVFSNAALHWIPNPQPVLANVYEALRPGGRFVAEQGGFGNVAAIRVAVQASLDVAGLPAGADPWDFPTPEEQRSRLEAAGFVVEKVLLFPRPTSLPTGFDGWLDTFGDALLGHLPPEQAEAVLADAVARLSVLVDATGTGRADYVRLRFVARKS